MTHDLARTFLYLDHGIAFTVRELVTRPGHAVREYVEGKRTRHFNPFKMLVVLAMLDSLLRETWGFTLADTSEPGVAHDLSVWIEGERVHHAKWLLLATIPLRAVLSYAWFRRARFVYAEHLLDASVVVGALVVSIVGSLLIDTLGASAEVGRHIVNAGTLVTLAYQALVYVQFFSRSGYSRVALVARSVLATLSLVAVLIAALLVAGLAMGS